MPTKEMYIVKMNQQLDEMKEAIDALEVEARKAGGVARKKYLFELTKLRRQAQLLARKLDELKSVAENSWENMIADVEKMRDAFVHSFHYLQSQFK
jgi:hypothetical protein